MTDLNSDQQQNGLQADLKIDRLTMGRFGLLPSAVDNTLYDAFGERQVSTIYNAMNQYAVVMEVAPEYWQNPETLKKLYVSTSGQVASGTQASTLEFARKAGAKEAIQLEDAALVVDQVEELTQGL